MGSLFWGYFPDDSPRRSSVAQVGTQVLDVRCHGFLLPSVQTHLAKWTPLQERNRTIAIVLSGTQFGTVLTMPIAGYLAASPWGWPSIFYCTGLCGVLWSVVWLFVAISDREREYIITTRIGSSSHSQGMKTPWRHILTSRPVWALTAAHFSFNWGKWTLITELSSFLRHVYGYDIKSNGLLSALPPVCCLLMVLVFSYIADFINMKEFISLTLSRKISNSIAQWGSAIGLCTMAFVSNPTSAVILLTVSIALTAGVLHG
ncbi:putative inorganic phosphate cotransporter [Homalodisca vitripennis]|uniref:putative inorganic phosphate cotransporter n=1 Tax=Homalodisca vitripennis TaxID=197043 RepID=UPI001EEAA10E|nr:putative inorganic phosphate cotransporter [Homalodisca vitripennis]